VSWHIGNLSYHPESFFAHCAHCKSSGLYWHCVADCRELYSEYILRVLLSPQVTNNLFDHGLSSFLLYLDCLKERAYTIFQRYLSSGYFVRQFQSKFRHPTWRPFRARMFISLGLSALFPVIHGIMKFGSKQMNKQIGLFWVILQGTLYIIGAYIYAVSPGVRLTNARSNICR